MVTVFDKYMNYLSNKEFPIKYIYTYGYWSKRSISLKSNSNIYNNSDPICIDNEQFKLLVEIEPKILKITNNVTELTSFPIFSKLKFLEIKHCQNLTYIPNLYTLTKLELTNCPKIQKIPNFPNLIELSLNGMNNICTIPISKNLKKIYVYECPLLINLDEMYEKFNDEIEYQNKLQYITIRYCKNIEIITPRLPNLVKIEGESCDKFKGFNPKYTFPKLRVIILNWCPNYSYPISKLYNTITM